VQDNGKPIINQKQVDMLLGLDISPVSYMKLVDNILIFCKDSDIIRRKFQADILSQLNP